MVAQSIKRGDQIVSDFLNSISSANSFDEETVAAIKELYGDDKLTNTKLLQRLAELRQASSNDISSADG